MYLVDDDAIYDDMMFKQLVNNVITTDMKSAGIHLMNY